MTLRPGLPSILKRSFGFIMMALILALLPASLIGQELEPHVKPNYRQAAQYSSRYLRQFLYSTSVRPNWIGKTDHFWYSFKTSEGTNYYRVDPSAGTKEPLFDRVKLGAQLGVFIKKPVDPKLLPITSVRVNEEGTEVSFVAERARYTYNLREEKLAKGGAAPTSNSGLRVPSRFRGSREDYIRMLRERGINVPTSGNRSSSSSHRVFSPDRKTYVFSRGHNLYIMTLPEGYGKDEKKEEKKSDDKKAGDKKSDDKKAGDKKAADKKAADQKKTDKKNKEEKKQSDDKKASETKGEKAKQEQDKKDGDKKDEKDSDKKKGDEKKEGDDKKDGEAKEDEKPKTLPIPKVKASTDREATQLTKDGVDRYSFAGRTFRFSRGGSRSRTEIKDDQKTRPAAVWSKDSRSFYVYRRDSRDVKELWVINSLSNPRPTLEKYDYPMPGEDKIRKTELYYFSPKDKKLKRVTPKWKDESYSNVHYGETGDELRFMRRDRLLRNVEFCTMNTSTGETKCLIEEGFQNANYNYQSMRYINDSKEMIWWSERSGWGHFYLYDRDGTLKNAITSGEFRASRIVSVDEKNRLMYFIANAREPNENVYFNHLYCVRLDGTGLRLMDPGNANHSSTLSPSKQFLVDNCSRVDMPPVSILRNADGKEIMKLEATDMSRLKEVGWQPPQTFVVKAADGVTDLYGNMWKPFNFNPKKKYPIIAHVYPGPQQEGTRHTFSATDGNQQLAQIGFIVIQVGHRGGAPYRSKAYGSYGYFNLRDYGLADKKAAIEQLAQRYNFIDVERVGIYGHSGGGFMTAAALLQKPYNDFFKVGVSTAGNHDNNIYNNSWSERYHGLKVASSSSTSSSSRSRTSGSSSSSTRSRTRTRLPDEYQRRGKFDVAESDHFYEYELDDPELAQLVFEYGPEAIEWLKQQQQPGDQDVQEKDQKAKQEGKKQNDKKEAARKAFEKEKANQDKAKTAKGKQDESKTKTDSANKQEKKGDAKKGDAKQDGKKDDSKKAGAKDDKKSDDKKSDDKKTSAQSKLDKVKFEIRVPTNAELAENLKGHLFLIHGEADNNVHPANTLRLVDALIKANKRFDMLYLPATRHGFGSYQPYVTQRMYEYFAEHLLNDYQDGADIGQKK